MKSFEDYRRRVPALSDKNTIRIMKRGATNTKRILGLCKLRICLDLMVQTTNDDTIDKSNSPYLGSVGNRFLSDTGPIIVYHCATD